MKKLLYLTLVVSVFVLQVKSQNASSLIKVHNVANTSQMNAIVNPNTGNLIYVTENSTMYQYDGANWIATGGSSNSWNITGNSGINSLNNFIGTLDNNDLSIRTNNILRLTLKTGGTNDFKLLFPKIVFFPASGLSNSAVIGIDGTQGRLRITAGDDDTFDNSLGASVDLHGNNAQNGFEGRLDLVAGGGASGTEQGINFYTTNNLRATILGNGNFGINTNNPTSRFHINGSGFRYVDGNQGNGRVLTSDANGNASWQNSSSGGTSGWSLTGNNISGTDFLGTSNNQPIRFRANNSEVARLETRGSITLTSQSYFIGTVSNGQSSTGNNNIGIGTNVLTNLTAGQSNVVIGGYSGNGFTEAFGNTVHGSYAMPNLTTGFSNTALGFSAYPDGSYNNSTAIGAYASVSASNQVQIGDVSVSTIGGQVAWSSPSDKRFKENIKDNVVGLDFIMNLKPISFNFNVKKLDSFQKNGRGDIIAKDTNIFHLERDYQKLNNINHIGFLAQEVEALADSLNFDFHGVDKPENAKGFYKLRYAEFVVPLVKAMQEQQEMIQELQQLKKIVREQQAVIENLITEVEELQE